MTWLFHSNLRIRRVQRGFGRHSMKHPLRPKDKKRFLQAITIVTLAFIIAGFTGGVTAGEVVLALLILVLGLQMIVLHRNAESRMRQHEALLSIIATTQPKAPLPDMQDWSAMPDLLKKLLELVLMERSTVILEAGSGASTLICAAALQKLGRGKVITLEHEAQFAEQTSRWLALHQLSDYAQVIHAPLVLHTLRGESWRWYDLSGVRLDTLEAIDLIVIDGPPRHTGWLARYPALPLLHSKLRRGGHVLLDDAGRRDEREIVRRWCVELNDMSSQYLPLAKGAALLRKA
jgi:predicted O-methyltransferase YrrM